jgi:cytochrome P450
MNTRRDIMAPEFRADPYPFYAEMRRSEPVVEVDPGGMWAVSRHEDVERILKSPELFAQGFRAAWQPPWLPQNPLASSVLALDEAPHARLRAIVSRAFGTRAVSRLEPRVRAIAGELASGIAAGAEVEVVSAFAVPLPAFVIGELLGLDPALQPSFKRWADDLVSITPVVEGPEQIPRVKATLAEITSYLTEVIAARRSSPSDDMVSDLIRAEAGGERLTDDELVSFLILLLLGGFDTTTYLIVNALLLLADRPDRVGRLRVEPGFIPGFVEEVLRYDAPVHGVPRVATADVDIAGVTIPRGALVLALLGSANRDERRFDEPDTFKMERGRQGLSFGHGIHACIGAALARLEGAAAIEALLARFRAVGRVPGELEYNRSLTVRGVVSLPLRFS